AAMVLAGGLAVGLGPGAATAAGCVGTNPTDVAIADLSTAESAIAISGCAGLASASATVEVHIVHTYRGDLVVSLVAPDGSAYVLQSRQGGSADNLDQIFPVNLSSETANGTWRLRVQDAASGDTGYLNTWTLTTVVASLCTQSNTTDVNVPDPGTASSSVTFTGCAGTAAANAAVTLSIIHTYSGDLVVSLVAPDGSVYILQNRQGGSVDNIVKTLTINLSSEVRNGTWTLRVQDASAADRGYIDSWTLSI
ncbi:MAG: hypothetical protein HOV66_24585, partial [Streptomycetaceae bacterium]|nr:hypothetical protein [Streptomycetaceae bacterium]